MYNGTVLWFTGLSGAGKTTIMDELVKNLRQTHNTAVLDGDVMRQRFGNDLGFSKEDRDKNIKRAVDLAKELSRKYHFVLAGFIAPYKIHRQYARSMLCNFIEVFVDTPLEICEKRDVKGLYKKARKGEIDNFTGISDIYEAPDNPDIRLKAGNLTIIQCVEKVLAYLKSKNYI